MIRACFIIATFIVGYAKPAWADITENDIHTVLQMNAPAVQAKQHAMQTQMGARVHIAYAFADWLMEQALNPATDKDSRGTYVNMAHLVLMGYGFGGVSETPATPAEWEIARRAGSSIGFITKQPGGLEPTLSDDGPIQLHWYNLYRFLEYGVKAAEALPADAVQPAALPVTWTWDVPKTVFRPSMYYRGEKSHHPPLGTLRNISGETAILNWPYYYSMKDILRELFPADNMPKFLVSYGKRLDHNYLGNCNDFLSHHNINSSTVTHAVGDVKLSEPQNKAIEWMLNRIPESLRGHLHGKIMDLENRLRAFIRSENQRLQAVKEILYLCTFYNPEEQDGFLTLIQNHMAVLGENLLQILFETRHMNMHEKEEFFTIIADDRIDRDYIIILCDFLLTVKPEDRMRNKNIFVAANIFQLTTPYECGEILKTFIRAKEPEIFFHRLASALRQIPDYLNNHRHSIMGTFLSNINKKYSKQAWEEFIQQTIQKHQEQQAAERQRNAIEAEKVRQQRSQEEQERQKQLNKQAIEEANQYARYIQWFEEGLKKSLERYDLGADLEIYTRRQINELYRYYTENRHSETVREESIRLFNRAVRILGNDHLVINTAPSEETYVPETGEYE